VFNLSLAVDPDLDEEVEEIIDLPAEEFDRMWSDASNWPNGQLPKDGDDVEINSAWNMIIDIAQTPIIRMLAVNGRLTFSDELDVELRARHVSIRGGELKIGTPYVPY
jgi:cell migration-inducing and hyaluronan-binding protein